MSMVSPASISALTNFVKRTEHGSAVTLDRMILLGILEEITQLQSLTPLNEQQKIDLIQKMTMEFSMMSISDSLKQLARDRWEGMTPSEVLLICAKKLEQKSDMTQKLERGTA